jgi:hypothetical protein
MKINLIKLEYDLCSNMASVFTSSTVDSGLETRGRTKLKTIKLVCYASDKQVPSTVVSV